MGVRGKFPQTVLHFFRWKQSVLSNSPFSGLWPRSHVKIQDSHTKPQKSVLFAVTGTVKTCVKNVYTRLPEKERDHTWALDLWRQETYFAVPINQLHWNILMLSHACCSLTSSLILVRRSKDWVRLLFFQFIGSWINKCWNSHSPMLRTKKPLPVLKMQSIQKHQDSSTPWSVMPHDVQDSSVRQCNGQRTTDPAFCNVVPRRCIIPRK